MSSLALGTFSSGLIGQARLIAQDQAASASGGALTDAQYTSLINEKYIWLREEVTPRSVYLSSTNMFGGAVSGQAVLTTPTNIKKLLALIPQASVGATVLGSAYERVEPNELADYNTSSSTFAAYRDTTQAGKWSIQFGTSLTAQPVAGFVTQEVTALSASSDVPDLSDHEGYIVARLAAWEAARLSGRDDAFIASIFSTIPQEIQDAMKTAENVKRPREHSIEDSY